MWTGIWITWGVLCAIALAAPEAQSVPVVPNFQQGTLKSSTTKTTQKGQLRSSTLTNIELATNNHKRHQHRAKWAISPTAVTSSPSSLSGVTSTWTGVDLRQSPHGKSLPWRIVSIRRNCKGPGLTNHTIIERTTDIESVTETLSTFTQ